MALSASEAGAVLQRELAADERLLWSGKPRAGFVWRPADAFLVPFSLMWGGFAVFCPVHPEPRGSRRR